MGATHKETVTELVKAMIQAGIVKPEDSIKSKDASRSILKKSIYLVEYGVKVFRDPNTQQIVDNAFEKETKDKKQKTKTSVN